jgi:hypothetical protein
MARNLNEIVHRRGKSNAKAQQFAFPPTHPRKRSQAVETRPNRLTKFLFSSLSRQISRNLILSMGFIVCSVDDCESVRSIGVEVADCVGGAARRCNRAGLQF